MNLHVTAPAGQTNGTLMCGYLNLPCTVGRSGIAIKELEGDGITPFGTFELKQIYYRADRVQKPVSGLPVVPITEDMGWCDDPASSHYNELITLPYASSHERLWREDSVYDYVVVIGYNTDPVAAGKGSAIFMHLPHADGHPTAGCIALAQPDMLTVLRQVNPGSKITIGNE